MTNRRITPSIPSMSLAVAGCFALLNLTVSATSGPDNQAPEAATPQGLESILRSGSLLQDRNSDGVIDFVAARILLGDPPSDSELAAAAEVALRLGFETSALELPFSGVNADGGLTIAIGINGLQRAGVSVSDAGLRQLQPGTGLLALSKNGRLLTIAGLDDTGTRTAASHFAARLPYVWSPDAHTLEDLVSAARTALMGGDLDVRFARVSTIVGDAALAGVRRLDLEIGVSVDDLDDAEKLLQSWGEGTALLAGTLRLLRISLTAPGLPMRSVEITGPVATAPDDRGRRGMVGASSKLDLGNLYSIEGLLADSDQNLIPDQTNALLSATGDRNGATTSLAARLGLESTGIVLPAALTAAEIDRPHQLPTLVLIGDGHPLIRQLIADDKLQLPTLAAGQGLIQAIPNAFVDDEVPFPGRTALIIIGGDNAGLQRAIEQVAVRFPHLWQRGKDRPTVEQVQRDLWLTIAGRSPAGQAATALYKLDRILATLADKELAGLQVSLHVERAASGLEGYVRDHVVERLGISELEVEIDDLDVQNAATIFEQRLQIPSEVDTFWELFESQVTPRLSSRNRVQIEARLSEPPEIRAGIQQQAERRLIDAGADPASTSVTVLSAYKQGYSWLYDVVRPALKDKPVDTLTIRFAEHTPPKEWSQQAMYTPSRWLLEIFPIDEVLAAALELDLDRIRFDMAPAEAPVYEVIAIAADGSELYRDRFDPKSVLRPVFDRFPDYEKVRVTTGWITATVGGQQVLDRRITTDMEAFWDHFQSSTLARLYEYVMAINEGKPRARDAPHFGELRVEVSLSEPDYAVGVDQERISSVEALHEEIYFGTLHFFDVLGRMARGEALAYPGRVIPVVRPLSDGRPGTARIRLTGFRSSRPGVVVRYQEPGGRLQEQRLDIAAMEIDQPRPLAALVGVGDEGLERLDFRVKVDFDEDRRDELVRRARSDLVDRTISSAEQMTAVLTHLASLRRAGLYSGALSYDGLGEIRLAAGWEHEISDQQRVVTLPDNGVPPPAPDIGKLLEPGEPGPAEPLVQWETPIPPQEAYSILAKMSTMARANAYRVGQSYLGKDIWAMDLMAPMEASHWSHAKATTFKPTLIYSARQHANEVSSTSHVLRFAELLLRDPDRAHVLDKVNVVIHPITNPDGAQLAYDLYRITPDHMLHAGYLGALGVDATAGADEEDPIYPEARVRPQLWNTWLPDVFLNPHGYPSHEWVQPFSEYAGWVRSRVSETRGWWGMRGWFMPSFDYIDDPQYPHHKEAAFAILKKITQKLNALPEIRALNQRAYDRYRRYGFAWDAENFKLDFTDEILIYKSIKGSRGDDDGLMSNPRVTIWSGSTEAPDETAHGDWMRMVASAGLAWDEAVLEYLLEGNHRIERQHRDSDGVVTLKIHRPRPAVREEDHDDGS